MESTLDCDKDPEASGGSGSGGQDGSRSSKQDETGPAKLPFRLSEPSTPTQSTSNQDPVNTSTNVISVPPPAQASTSHPQHLQVSRPDHGPSSGSPAAKQERLDLLASGGADKGQTGRADHLGLRAPDQKISAPEVDSADPVGVQSSLPLVLPLTSADTSHQQQQQASVASNQGLWLAQVASQTQQGVRQRMSQASDQLGVSLRQMYASASSITSAAAAAAAGGVAVGAAVVDVPPSYHNIPGIVPYYHGRSVGPPPSYDDVINPYAPPPSYQSLFGQLREARKTSRGLVDLLRRLVIILASTLGCTLLIAFMILIPFTMIIIGAIYIDECKIEHIPAFLLVGGLVWASKNIIHCYGQCRKVERQEHSDALAAELYLNSASSSFEASSASSSPSPSASSSSSSTSSSADNFGAACTSTTRAAPNAPQDCATLAPASGAFSHDDMLDGLHLGQRMSAASSSSANNTTATGTRPHRDRHRQHRHSRHHNHHHNQRRNRHAEQHQQQQRRSTSRLKSSICESLLNCVLFGWFIAGCVIVFRNYEPDFDNPASARYCHRTVYMYTFWLITSAILSFGLFISCICCLMVSSALASRQSDIGLA